MTWSRIKRTAQQILHLGDSPRRTALAFAIGVFIAFSPTYGLHTISVFLFAWAFRLNVVAMLAGSLVNNPWTLLPILGSTMWVGLKLLPSSAPPPLNWSQFTFQMLSNPSHFTFQMLWYQLQPFFLPFVVGATVLGILASLMAYPLVRVGLQRYHEHQRIHGPLPGSVPDETK
jgi:uncharacterized protein (DUF2062 family)